MGIFGKRNKEIVPTHLTPAGKEVEVKRKVQSNFLPWLTMLYEGENGFTYVDNKAVEENYNAASPTWHP